MHLLQFLSPYYTKMGINKIKMATYPTPNPTQRKAIKDFKPPRIYRWFYRQWKKWLSKAVWIMLVTLFPLGFFQKFLPMWQILIGALIIFGSIVFFALIMHLIKHFYTKKYAANIGMTLKHWNMYTTGMTWDD